VVLWDLPDLRGRQALQARQVRLEQREILAKLLNNQIEALVRARTSARARSFRASYDEPAPYRCD
jgi:hypothetical protein